MEHVERIAQGFSATADEGPALPLPGFAGVRGHAGETADRRIKIQTVLPCAETVPMLLWALLASGQICMRKVDGWETLSQPIEPFALDQAA